MTILYQYYINIMTTLSINYEIPILLQQIIKYTNDIDSIILLNNYNPKMIQKYTSKIWHQYNKFKKYIKNVYA